MNYKKKYLKYKKKYLNELQKLISGIKGGSIEKENLKKTQKEVDNQVSPADAQVSPVDAQGTNTLATGQQSEALGDGLNEQENSILKNRNSLEREIIKIKKDFVQMGEEEEAKHAWDNATAGKRVNCMSDLFELTEENKISKLPCEQLTDYAKREIEWRLLGSAKNNECDEATIKKKKQIFEDRKKTCSSPVQPVPVQPVPVQPGQLVPPQLALPGAPAQLALPGPPAQLALPPPERKLDTEIDNIYKEIIELKKKLDEDSINKEQIQKIETEIKKINDKILQLNILSSSNENSIENLSGELSQLRQICRDCSAKEKKPGFCSIM